MKRAAKIFSALVIWLSCFSSFVYANTLESVRVRTSSNETRIVMDMASSPKYSYFSLTSPHRLVVDLKNSDNQAKLPLNVQDSVVLKRIRKSTPPNAKTTRLVLELKTAVNAKLFTLDPASGNQKGHRLVIDLPHGKNTKPASKPSKPSTTASTSASTSTVTKDASRIVRNKDVLIVIDPGHGGKDPGSVGPSRKYEKNVTLSISRQLAQKLNALDGIKARLTRNGDYFVNLNRRVAVARENNAHLLISIHADAFTSPKPRGGSVFVLNTRRANTEIARWIENRERQSELLGGSGNVIDNDDKNVNQTLLDLQFSYSQKEGYKLAEEILKEMGKVTKLHKSKPVNTSLAVLRSPQIPSVLVELGFISNPTEEKLLFQRTHQRKLVAALSNAVATYLKKNPPEGTHVSSSGSTASASTHTVKSGESLSIIAKKYSTTSSAIMKENQLKSSKIMVGQKLKLPGRSVSNSTSTSMQTSTHVVAPGEYLGMIAKKYQVSVTDIKRQNNLKREALWVGQKLKITHKPLVKPAKKHKVLRGEYLGKIAAKYGVSMASIRSANKLSSDELVVGQILIIPSK